ncbi:hypothetical protein ABW19_dt0205838 [Dactylella cylindrospora]|nr:hypothetical protein ABW19_dt0205838 [Dactylella cylindrospora]
MAPSGQKRLEQAITDFKNSLKPEDRLSISQISNPNAEDVSNFVQAIDEKLSQRQKRRRLLQNSPFETFVRSMQQFSGIVDTCVQSNPEVAALVWGGMKFVLLGFANYLKYLEEIADMCEQMGRLCPQYERFSNLFPSHMELQSCICEFYAIVINFFQEALQFLYSSVIKQFTIATFRPFQDKFNDILKSLALVKEIVEKEIYLASEQELHVERINAAQARAEATDFYNHARIAYHDFQDDRIRLNDQVRRSKRERMIQNICDYAYYFDLSHNLQKRLEGSGRWIFDRSEYRNWFNSPISAGLWYHAIPGFGKSVLTAGVVDDLLEISKSTRERHLISYFFCTYTNAQSLLAYTIMSSILQQLLYYSNDIPPVLEPKLEKYFHDKQSASRVTTAVLQEMIIEILNGNRARNFIIIDGLDECNDAQRGTLLRTLKQIYAAVPNSLKILISSRGSYDINRSLTQFQQLDLLSSNQQDIETFIAQTLINKKVEGQLPELPQELFDRIKKILAEKAKGLFIWVDLQISELCSEYSVGNIEDALQNLPKDLDELYKRVLDRIQRLRKLEVAREIFLWVAYAIRPLTLQELIEATTLNDPDITSWTQLRQRAEIDSAKWLQHCENLVTLDKGAQIVRFAHSTVKDFLVSAAALGADYNGDPSRHHKVLGDCCIKYFQFPEIIGDQQKCQHSTISKQQAQALKWLPDTITKAESSWGSWLTHKVYQYALRPESNLGGRNASSALVKVKDDRLAIAQRRSFKQLLRAYNFLEYATYHWVAHYEIAFPDVDELPQYISDTMRTKHESIRFPWQSYFSPELTDQYDDMVALMEWALLKNFKIPFIALGRLHWNFILPEYFFHGAELGKTTTFELVYQNDAQWLTFKEILTAAMEYSFKERGAIFKDPSLLRNLILHACHKADVELYWFGMNFISEITRPNRPGGGPRVSETRYLELPWYEAAVNAAILSGSIEISVALQTPSFGFLHAKQTVDSRYFILQSSVGRSEIFEMLLNYPRYSQILDYKPKVGPTILQKAAQDGDLKTLRLCLEKGGVVVSCSEDPMHQLYPIQLAAKYNHTECVKCIVPYQKNFSKGVDMRAFGNANTALAYAFRNQNSELVHYLLSHGAIITIKRPPIIKSKYGDQHDGVIGPFAELVQHPMEGVVSKLPDDVLDKVVDIMKEDPLNLWDPLLSQAQVEYIANIHRGPNYKILKTLIPALERAGGTQSMTFQAKSVISSSNDTKARSLLTDG